MAIPTRRRAWAKPAHSPAPAPPCGISLPLATYQAARLAALLAIRIRHRAHLRGMDDGICENAARVSYERLQEAVAFRRAWTLAGKVPAPARVSSHASCHTLRRVLVRLPARVAGYEWTIRACGMLLFSDVERASGVCRSCASGWTHPEDHPVVPVFDAAAHARFSLRHWHVMQEQAETSADLARAAEGVAVWSARVATLARLSILIAKEPGPPPAV